MFCVCVVIVLILVSFSLCCAPSCAFFVLLLLVFITRICVHRLRVGSLPTFECLSTHLLRVNAPPSRGLSFFIACALPSRGLSFRV
jgi:hypothetical protein